MNQFHCTRQLGTASAAFADSVLTVSTGELRRRWQWTNHGFVTVSLDDLNAGRSWCRENPSYSCDWILPGLEDDRPKATLIDLSIHPSDDERFTSEHLEVIASIDYPRAHLQIQHVVWVYPDSPGIRVQLRIRGMENFQSEQAPYTTGRVEHLPLIFGQSRRRMFGYYNDTQRRNDTHLDILKEEVIENHLRGPEWCDWSSGLCVEDDRSGLALLRESHRCVNQVGHDCGHFYCDPDTGLEATGWGVLPQEIGADRYRAGWATWCLVYGPTDVDRQLAFKRFDRLRYPTDPGRDNYIMANIWGSCGQHPGERGPDFAMEDVVLREIDSQADLGIDVQQIDDGWQSPPDRGNWQAEQWHPHPERYPEGWKRVVERAKKKGVTLALWAAAQPIPLEDLKWNFDQADFRHFKLDFANLPDRDAIDALLDKVRTFVLYTDHQVRVNWDVTENPPRYGYFFARECGLLYLENRKPAWPPSTVYRPHTVLRDAWQLARYINLNQIQLSVQNLDRVDPNRSDANLHTHPYSVAITLMGTPLFFQLTQRYTQEARNQIRPLLQTYKEHRQAIYRGHIFPIGHQPDNASWTGFQCHLPDEKSGYLTIFRELHNPDPEQSIQLHFLNDATLTFENLLTGDKTTISAEAEGRIPIRIDNPADFRFMRYTY